VRYLQGMREALVDRYERLVDGDDDSIDHEVTLIRDWINEQPALRAILAEVANSEPAMDFEDWRSRLGNVDQFKWPSRSEAGRAWTIWQLMNAIATAHEAGAEYQVVDYAMQYAEFGKSPNSMVRAFVSRILSPLFRYLGEHVAQGSAVLHTLERYVARVEWYDRNDLYARYEAARSGNHVGEDVYDLDLQRFLFLDGGYITQAKARSASGEADIIGGLATSDPLICEGKLFDNRGKRHIVKGFHQVIKYAHDYNKTTAHLVVFNLTDRLLRLPTDDPSKAWPPCIEESGVRVNFIVVRALPPATTASAAGKATVVEISRGDLISLDAAEEPSDQASIRDTNTVGYPDLDSSHRS